MTAPLKLDLKNRPAAPLDFPHRCFEIGQQLKAAAEILAAKEPWPIRNQEYSISAQFADVRAEQLFENVKGLLTGPESYVRKALDIIPRNESNHADGNHRMLWLDGLEKEVSKAVEEQKLVPRIQRVAQLLDNVGVLFFRMFQLLDSQHLPDEIEVTPTERREPIRIQ